ncbi:MAG: pyridoxamine 5'-phosphate oxidase [Gammaproteobacteria bacterium]|nr:pyridoxamine 5'-phosphate oxidase [Gammaproteobacteria bacterium]NIR97698.1 pyridoxamine 5'-phosphate oxidase [Gammaproteobacteria bacterium]NIT62891.1 pyridoxamine 5'-phosphate oxidase [Gammaproteobacteria bacterium]NIV19856.1 pyridoxamine 5'-phosphate oxidase [Gammaproteobacteria bacterium]NIX11369.1 pyridoxamine 5'-phosphate oxidase [Gammaproteobacteria bacterium]
MNGPDPFTAAEREAQRRWGRPGVWDAARRRRLLWDHVPAEYRPRIEAAPFLFLATANRQGECDCSFKGGGPGLVRMLDVRRLAFPDFDGNHAFMSLGNILDNPNVGLLFIDFADGARLRVNGRAQIHDAGAPLAWFEDARRVVEVAIEQVVPNCAARVPRLVPAAEVPS